MGAGIYLIWPAFYTDVTDSYRLSRGGRVLTDLGGLYFNAIVAVGITGVWWMSRYDALLLIVAAQILQMVRQLIPLVRFDGYHVLADVTGVPDLFHRIKPTLLGILPWRWRDSESTMLKPWARLVVTSWVLLVVPILACTLYVMVIAMPRVVGTAWAAAEKQAALMGNAWADADLLAVVGRGFGVLAVLFPVFAIALILGRLIRRVVTRVWASTRGRPMRRAVAAALACAMMAGLAAAWWPRAGAYRPIQAYEGGTLMQVAQTSLPRASPARI
jgi:putative peptide zinc metalloprotease protein